MRIVIDMQGAQTESRYRGIGRYTLAFVKAVISNRGNHEVILVLNGLFSDTVEPIKKIFSDLIPPNNIKVWQAVGPIKEMHCDNEDRRLIAEKMWETFISGFSPDIVHVTSLFEGYVDDAAINFTDIAKNTILSVIVYDLIPLLSPETYLTPNPHYESHYLRKIKQLKSSSVFLAISNHSKVDLQNSLAVPEDSVFNISGGVEDSFQTLEIDNVKAKSFLENLGINKKFLLYTGGADERKNLSRLIKAYSVLEEEIRSDFQLVFAGRIPDGNIIHIKHLAKELGLKDSELNLVGYVTDSELVQLYNLCYLYIFPSWYEGFGLPVLEAMACGAPVIGSNTSCLPEIIGLATALFNPFDEQSISNKIRDVILNKELHEQLLIHTKNQVKKFSWNKTAIQSIKIWKEKTADSYDFNWEDWMNRQDQLQSELINHIVEILKSSNQITLFDKDIAAYANAISYNRGELESYWRQQEPPDVLNWRVEGPFDSTYSLALVNREFAKAVHELGHVVSLHSTEGPGDFEPSQQFLRDNPLFLKLHRNSKNKSHLSANVCSRNLYPPRVEDMNSYFNMLHCYGWEETAFPKDWVLNFNEYLQGMTVMSEHCKKIFIDNGVSIPIKTSGIGVNHWEEVKPDKNFTLLAKSFRFLHISSCFPRKGVDVMLEAYGKAFTIEDDVTLVIKTFPNPHNNIHELIENLRANSKDYPDVITIESDLSNEQIKSLYNQCHALVAPSRAEGFGLPMAEAMLCELPVITTNWSGQTEFCTSKTSWLIDYDFQKAETHFSLYSSAWANPKADHLTLLMKEVYNLPEQQRALRPKNGRKLLLEKYKWSDVADINTAFVKKIFSRKEKITKNPHVAWVSTWNTKCGIATHSSHILDQMESSVAVLAQRTNELVNSDKGNVHRCWNMDDNDELLDLSNTIEQLNIDVIVVQFNYGFFNLEHLASFLKNQKVMGRKVIVILHSTVDPDHVPQKKLQIILPALKDINRVLVHSISDLNRLKRLGILDNVTLFPLGVKDHQPSPPTEIKLSQKIYIASYGFFLPHKGLFELIEAVSLLRNSGLDIKLIMVNSEFPAPESKAAVEKAKKLISKLNLEQDIELHTDYLSDNLSLQILENAQLVVYPYQKTGESASAAVRFGIIAERDVAVTPLDIFSDVSDITFRLPGCTPKDIATGIESWLNMSTSNHKTISQLRLNAENWRSQHRFSVIASRLDNLIKAIINMDNV